MKISYEKTFQGAHRISAIINGHLCSAQYFFCSKREAIAQFKNQYKG